jgi:hypothetical protein
VKLLDPDLIARLRVDLAGTPPRAEDIVAHAKKARRAQRKNTKRKGPAPIIDPTADVETQVQQELASRKLAKTSLLHYIERNIPDYEAGWVHEDICRRLENFVRGR